LVPWLHAGEGGDGEKVEGVVVHVRNEEKGESIEGKVTSYMRTYQCTLHFCSFILDDRAFMQDKKLPTAMHFSTVWAWHEIPDFGSGIV